MLNPVIIDKINNLPPELQDMVRLYIDFLLQQYQKMPANHVENTQKRGGFGVMKGKIKMSADFDAPLEDFNDYCTNPKSTNTHLGSR